MYPGRRVWQAGWAMVLAMLALSSAGSPQPTSAAAAVPVVGVIDFYAITPVPPVVGIIPERFAADDLSAMLAREGAERVTVVPRATVQQAEQAVGWRDGDVLRYARLSNLARRLRAGRLVVGWIKELTNSRDSSEVLPRMGGGPIMGSAAVVVQVFDASAGRIVMEKKSDAFAVGLVRPVLTEMVLHRALAPTVAPLLDALSASSY